MARHSFTASAPGKVILFGEHAVVYGFPAIALPVLQLKACVLVEDISDRAPDGFIQIDAEDIDLHSDIQSLPADNPLSLAIRGTLVFMGIKKLPSLRLQIDSSIPVAAGLGSGAAVSVAIVRALAGFFNHVLPPEIVSGLAYEVEKKHHGQPSGIDNTVITYAQPIYFQRVKPFEILPPCQPISLVIADTGIASPTARAVAGVKERRDKNPAIFQALFEEIGAVAVRAKQLLLQGPLTDLGPLMIRNHGLLREIGVSCLELDNLVQAALDAGALGAKLSGGGLGGNIIALAQDADSVGKISKALLANGAKHCYSTTVTAAGATHPK
jgi:mevalonate kinase